MAGDKRNRKLLCAGERTEKILCATEECTPRSRGLWKENLKNLKATTSKQKTPGSPGAFQKQQINHVQRKIEQTKPNFPNPTPLIPFPNPSLSKNLHFYRSHQPHRRFLKQGKQLP